MNDAHRDVGKWCAAGRGVEVATNDVSVHQKHGVDRTLGVQTRR